MAVHLGLFLLTAGWLVLRAADTDWRSGTRLALALSSAWLIAGPSLVVVWEARLQRLQQSLVNSGEFDRDVVLRVQTETRRFLPVSWVLVTIPVALVTAAFLAGGPFLTDEVGLAPSGIEHWLACGVLATGGLAAGYGVSAAVRTIVFARALARERGRFFPYAGVPSQMARSLADFSFSSAFIYGLGGSVLLPGLTAATSGTVGIARVVLVIAVVLIVGCTAGLLAVPAFFLARHHSDERDTYLGDLAAEIDELASRAAGRSADFTEAEYRRLRALLDLRSHVVQQSIGLPSVEMVKRIPLAVLVPVASTAAGWLAVIVR
ncbi:MAG: hypothetical protein Q7V88_07200 [Actinomycetota bacterium]|nr:hypothetical protein [Actinomycetota bacterium]